MIPGRWASFRSGSDGASPSQILERPISTAPLVTSTTQVFPELDHTVSMPSARHE